MKRLVLAGLLVMAIGVWSGAQLTTPEQSPNPWPAGTTIPVELSKALDAKKAKVDDRIEARIPADVLSHGQIVIPRSAKIIGHVTEVKTHTKESSDSKLGIAFDKIVMKDGKEAVLLVVVQAVARPLQVVVPDTRMGEGGGISTASASSGTMPSRSAERVAAIPIDAGSGSDAPPPTTVAPLAATSQGVVGMKGLSLKASAGSSVISSETDNVHLESGTQMILRAE